MGTLRIVFGKYVDILLVIVSYHLQGSFEQSRNIMLIECYT
jgi:hypothetical protein